MRRNLRRKVPIQNQGSVQQDSAMSQTACVKGEEGVIDEPRITATVGQCTFGANREVLKEEEDPRFPVLVEKSASVRRKRADECSGVGMPRQRRDGRWRRALLWRCGVRALVLRLSLLFVLLLGVLGRGVYRCVDGLLLLCRDVGLWRLWWSSCSSIRFLGVSVC